MDEIRDYAEAVRRGLRPDVAEVAAWAYLGMCTLLADAAYTCSPKWPKNSDEMMKIGAKSAEKHEILPK